jgi:hypothetical protein
MAIDGFYLNLVKDSINHLRKSGRTEIRCLELAYPDLIASAAEIEALFGPEVAKDLPIRPDSEPILRHHGMVGRLPGVFDTHALFERLGLQIEVIDIAINRGMERIVDLNDPLPADLHQRFDLLIDTGTLEHCFNVGQAFKNTCEAMRQGGVIVHGAPLNRFNHGFWSFNPTLYYDFLGDNGFQILWLKGVQAGPGMKPQIFDLPPFDRFNQAPAGSAIIGIFQRREIRPIAWPVQRKYRPAPQAA